VGRADGSLAGRRVIVTRARAQAGELVRLLEERSAEVLVCPVIRFEDPDDWGPADAAIASIRDYDWVVFTSRNGVDRFFARLASRGLDARALADACVAAVGPATASALERHGIATDLVPNERVAEGLLAALEARGPVRGLSVLIPRAQEAREVLPDELAARGAKVDVAPVYRTVGEGAAPEPVREALAGGSADAILFTSASTVKRFAALFAPSPLKEVLAGVMAASIGPVTSDAARELGLCVAVEPDEYTTPALVDALAAALGPAPGRAE
jgi:uroporphyrinogen III methyltransferase/synthase